eukprot:g17018.t1
MQEDDLAPSASQVGVRTPLRELGNAPLATEGDVQLSSKQASPEGTEQLHSKPQRLVHPRLNTQFNAHLASVVGRSPRRPGESPAFTPRAGSHSPSRMVPVTTPGATPGRRNSLHIPPDSLHIAPPAHTPGATPGSRDALQIGEQEPGLQPWPGWIGEMEGEGMVQDQREGEPDEENTQNNQPPPELHHAIRPKMKRNSRKSVQKGAFQPRVRDEGPMVNSIAEGKNEEGERNAGSEEAGLKASEEGGKEKTGDEEQGKGSFGKQAQEGVKPSKQEQPKKPANSWIFTGLKNQMRAQGSKKEKQDKGSNKEKQEKGSKKDKQEKAKMEKKATGSKKKKKANVSAEQAAAEPAKGEPTSIRQLRGMWPCPECGVGNDARLTNCDVCDSERPSEFDDQPSSAAPPRVSKRRSWVGGSSKRKDKAKEQRKDKAKEQESKHQDAGQSSEPASPSMSPLPGPEQALEAGREQEAPPAVGEAAKEQQAKEEKEEEEVLLPPSRMGSASRFDVQALGMIEPADMEESFLGQMEAKDPVRTVPAETEEKKDSSDASNEQKANEQQGSEGSPWQITVTTPSQAVSPAKAMPWSPPSPPKRPDMMVEADSGPPPEQPSPPREVEPPAPRPPAEQPSPPREEVEDDPPPPRPRPPVVRPPPLSPAIRQALPAAPAEPPQSSDPPLSHTAPPAQPPSSSDIDIQPPPPPVGQQPRPPPPYRHPHPPAASPPERQQQQQQQQRPRPPALPPPRQTAVAQQVITMPRPPDHPAPQIQQVELDLPEPPPEPQQDEADHAPVVWEAVPLTSVQRSGSVVQQQLRKHKKEKRVQEPEKDEHHEDKVANPSTRTPSMFHFRSIVSAIYRGSSFSTSDTSEKSGLELNADSQLASAATISSSSASSVSIFRGTSVAFARLSSSRLTRASNSHGAKSVSALIEEEEEWKDVDEDEEDVNDVKVKEQGPAQKREPRPYGVICCSLAAVVAICAQLHWNNWRLAELSHNPFLGPSPITLAVHGAKYGPAMGPSSPLGYQEWWRFFTPSLLCAGFLDLFFTIAVMSTIGYHLNRTMGSLNLIVIYVLAGVVGTAWSLLLLPSEVTVCSSAGMFGLMGAFLCDLLYEQRVIPAGRSKALAYTSIVLAAILGLGMGWLPLHDNFAHLGGLGSGFLLGMILTSGRVSEVASTNEQPDVDDLPNPSLGIRGTANMHRDIEDFYETQEERKQLGRLKSLRLIRTSVAYVAISLLTVALFLLFFLKPDLDLMRQCGALDSWGCQALSCVHNNYWSCGSSSSVPLPTLQSAN